MRTRNVLNDLHPCVVWFRNEKAYVEDREAIKVLIESRLRTILGEVFTDKEIGVPYFSKINDKDTYDMLISGQVLEVEGVKDILDINSKIIDKVYHATLKILTIFGEVSVEV